MINLLQGKLKQLQSVKKKSNEVKKKHAGYKYEAKNTEDYKIEHKEL